MTQAWAIKGPDGRLVHVELDDDEEYTWSQFRIQSESPNKKFRDWKAEGYTCAPVTITEGAAEPVAWATGYRAGIEAAAGQFPRHLAVTQDQADFANAILRTIRDLPVTGPPADESRALLEEETKDLRTYRDAIGHFLSLALNAKSASEHEHWLYRMRDHHNRSIKDHLARSGK